MDLTQIERGQLDLLLTPDPNTNKPNIPREEVLKT